MENNTKKCQYCQSEINEKASVCPICKRNIVSPLHQNVSGSAIIIILIIIGIPAFFIYRGIDVMNDHIEKDKQYEYGGYSSYSELSFKSIIETKSKNLSNAISLYEDKIFIFQGKVKYIGESYFQIEYKYKGLGYNFDIYWMDSQKSKINKLKKGDNVKFYAVVDDLNPLFGYCTLEKAIII